MLFSIHISCYSCVTQWGRSGVSNWLGVCGFSRFVMGSGGLCYDGYDVYGHI
jgi:hypothetical protein